MGNKPVFSKVLNSAVVSPPVFSGSAEKVEFYDDLLVTHLIDLHLPQRIGMPRFQNMPFFGCAHRKLSVLGILRT